MTLRLKARGKLRYRADLEKKVITKATLVIQCASRKTFALKIAAKLRKIRNAATKIAANLRSFLVRKRINTRLVQQNLLQSAVVTAKVNGSTLVSGSIYLVLSTMLLDTSILSNQTHNFEYTERAPATEVSSASQLKCIALQKTVSGKRIAGRDDIDFEPVVVSSLFIRAILVVSVMDNDSNCYGQVS